MTTFLPAGTDPAAVPGSPVVIVGADDRRGTFDAFAAALGFGDYFGRNLDALLDCLRDLPDDPAFAWTGVAALRRSDPVGYRGILDVLGQFQRERPQARVFVIG